MFGDFFQMGKKGFLILDAPSEGKGISIYQHALTIQVEIDFLRHPKTHSIGLNQESLAVVAVEIEIGGIWRNVSAKIWVRNAISANELLRHQPTNACLHDGKPNH